MSQKDPVRKRALIVKFGQIGDVIMAIPAVRALHDEGFEIVWACGKAARPILDCYEWITIIQVDDRAILRGSLLERLRGVAAFWRTVLGTRYDLCATLYYDRRFHMLTAPIRARRKASLSGKQRSTLLLPGRHHTDEYERVLLQREDGFLPRSTGPVRPDRFPPSPLPATVAARRIILFPGGTSNLLGEQVLRRWPVESYVVLARLLLARAWEVVLSGGPEDAWVRPHFAQLAVLDRIGTFPLPEVISACDQCDAVITHDTGPLHLAGMSTACLVSIFGPTDPSTRVPRRSGAVGIWGGQGFACRPCYDGRDFAPCKFNGCMHQVTPELVLRELDRLLAARESGLALPWSVVAPIGT